MQSNSILWQIARLFFPKPATMRSSSGDSTIEQGIYREPGVHQYPELRAKQIQTSRTAIEAAKFLGPARQRLAAEYARKAADGLASATRNASNNSENICSFDKQAARERQKEFRDAWFEICDVAEAMYGRGAVDLALGQLGYSR